jgi:hypothetical protein
VYVAPSGPSDRTATYTPLRAGLLVALPEAEVVAVRITAGRIGSSACPPSSRTCAAPALTSATSKYVRVPRFPGSMLVIAPPELSVNRVIQYSPGPPGYDWNSHPKSAPQNARACSVSSAGISICTISPAIRPSFRG